MNTKSPAINLFHKHLDECDRCQSQPIDLCAQGAWLLQHTATVGDAQVPPPPPMEAR